MPKHTRGTFIVVVLGVIFIAIIAALIFTTGKKPPADTSPATATAGSAAVRHFEYVFPDGAIDVYDIDNGNRLFQHIAMPQISGVRGVIMSPVTGALYVAYGGQGGDTGSGSMVSSQSRETKQTLPLVPGTAIW